MFYYDDSKKLYEICFANGIKNELTTQELWDFFFIEEHGIKDSFECLVDRLNKEESISARDTVYDWTLQTTVYRGMLTLTKIKQVDIAKIDIKKNSDYTICSHSNKYINQAGGVRFWVCPSCKKDLGNA